MEPLSEPSKPTPIRARRTKELIVVQPAKWVRQELLFPIFGISPEAARKYRSTCQWHEGQHWNRDPANRIVYNREAIERWMAGAV